MNIPVAGVKYLGFCQYGNEKLSVGGSLTLSVGKPPVIVIFLVSLLYLQLINALVNPFSVSVRPIFVQAFVCYSISIGTKSFGIYMIIYESLGTFAFGRRKNLIDTGL